MPLPPRPAISQTPPVMISLATVFLIVLHALPIIAIAMGTTAADWWTFAATHLFIALAVGTGLHRYFAHHAFRTSRFVQALIAVGTCIAFTDPIGFSGKHRIHHRWSDTEGDPHSPVHGWFSCWIWSLADDHLSNADVTGACPDLMRYPELRWLHRFYWVPGITLGAVYFAWGGLPRLGVGYALALASVLHITSAVNYACHRWGSRRYDTSEGSRNNVIVAVLSWGEGWHNNHHRYPMAARAGFAWWEIDVNYYLIRTLALVGIVWDVREVPADVRADGGLP
jgi:stearoyl-CoA desaturase (delta-9 desaturase)